MRNDKTLKILMNTLVDPRIEVSKMDTSENSWVFSCFDFSTGELKEEIFGVKLKTPEDAVAFNDAFKKSQDDVKALYDGEDGATEDASEKKETDEATEALSNLSTGAEETAKEGEGTEGEKEKTDG